MQWERSSVSAHAVAQGIALQSILSAVFVIRLLAMPFLSFGDWFALATIDQVSKEKASKATKAVTAFSFIVPRHGLVVTLVLREPFGGTMSSTASADFVP